jgi:hypothetical protein
MDISAVDICNLALDLIGQGPPIVSFDEGSNLANTFKRRYPLSRNEVLRIHPWNFAIHRENLVQLTETPDSGYTYQYQLPVDPLCLRVLEVTNVVNPDYRIEGDRLLTNETEVSIRYIKEVVDTSKFDSLFCKALALRIASDIAFQVTQDHHTEQAMEMKFEMYINRAMGKDNLEEKGPDVTDNSWIEAGR